jgi:hypothetical protein
MSCIIDNGYTLGCSSIGGVEEVYIGTFAAAATYTLSATNVITAAASAPTVYRFEQDVEYGGLSQTGVFTRENGTVHYDTVLSIKLIELDAELRNTILALGKAPIYAVVKSNAGLFYLLGLETAGRATNGVASLGTAMSDMNGATMEFTFKSQNGAFLMDSTVLGTDITIG